MIQLSLIIPVFNAQEYIVETLNSVLIGITEEVEVILVNDGSTDNSAELIKDNFPSQLNSGLFALLEQENSGVSIARNVGIERSKGKYIGFVDADDFLLPGYFSEVLKIISDYSVDIIEFGYKTFCHKVDLKIAGECFIHSNFGMLKREVVSNDIFAASTWYSWSRVIKGSFLKQFTFPQGVNFCEDMMLLTSLYPKSKYIYHINKALYGYRINEAGATLNVRSSYFTEMVGFYKKYLSCNSKYTDYLKLNIFYVMYRCAFESNIKLNIDNELYIDSKKLFFRLLFDKRIPLRKKLILGCPSIFRKFASLKEKLKARKEQ